jgi:hypothetical protein
MRQKIGIKSGLICLLALLAVVSLITIGCGGSSSSDNGIGGSGGDGGNSAQTYTVNGMCTEVNGTTVIPGATVSCTDGGARSGIRAFGATTTADSAGQYTLFGVPPGNYKITITADGHVPTVSFFTVITDTTQNLFCIDTNAWSAYAGAGHPYDASKGYMLVNTISVDQSGLVTKLPGVVVSTTPAGGGVGYVTSSVVDWAAAATSADGQAFIYSLTGGSYTINGTKEAYSFVPVTNAEVSAGMLYVYDLAATNQASQLKSIAINPATTSVPAGLSKQLRALGTYNDGTIQDLTGQCTWTSSNTAFGTVGNGDAAGAKGLFTAVQPGAVTITATFGTVSGQAGVTVSTSTLTSIVVSPGQAYAANKAPQNQLQFHATGFWSDGTSLDITSLAQWNTKAPSVAGVGTIDPATGLFTAVTPGTITVYCVYKGVTSQDVLVTVGTKLVTAIVVNPGAKTIPYGFVQDFTATATYDDASTQDVTSFCTWTSSALDVGTISLTTSIPQTAQFTTTGPGSCQVEASIFGDMKGSSNVTVLALLTLTVDPTGITMGTDNNVQISAWASYEGTSQEYDVTRRVLWTSTGTGDHGGLVGNVNENGWFTSLDVGQAVVVATLGSLTAQTTIMVRWGEIARLGDPFIESLGPGTDPKLAVAANLYNSEYQGTIPTVGASYTTGSGGSSQVVCQVRGIKKLAEGQFVEDIDWSQIKQSFPTDPALGSARSSALGFIKRTDEYLTSLDVPPYYVEHDSCTPVVAYQSLGGIWYHNYDIPQPSGWLKNFGPYQGGYDGFDPSISVAADEYGTIGMAYEANGHIMYASGESNGHPVFLGASSDTLVTGSVASLALNLASAIPSFSCELGAAETAKQLFFSMFAGGAWSDSSVESTSGYRSSMAINPVTGFPAVAYESTDGVTRVIKYAEATDAQGTAWTKTVNVNGTVVTTGVIDQGITPRLDFSDDGRPAITYATGTGRVYYAYRNSASKWNVNCAPYGTVDGNISSEGLCDGPCVKMATVWPMSTIGPAVLYVKNGTVVFQKRYSVPDLP